MDGPGRCDRPGPWSLRWLDGDLHDLAGVGEDAVVSDVGGAVAEHEAAGGVEALAGQGGAAAVPVDPDQPAHGELVLARGQQPVGGDLEQVEAAPLVEGD